jgi:putative ABC transport system permease protein
MEIGPILSTLVRSKTGAVLVALQVALSLGILANTLYIVNERRGLAARPSGIDDEHAVFSIAARSLSDIGPEQQLALHDREIAALRALPGVVSVANTSQSPMSQSGWNKSVALDRRQAEQSANASLYESPDSLVKTWGLKLVEGRDFLPQDAQDIDLNSNAAPHLAIITAALARKLWPGQRATGKTMYFGTGEGANEVRVVGVVERLQSAFANVGERGEWSGIVPVRSYGGKPVAMYTVRVEPGQRERMMKEAEAALRAASPRPVLVRSQSVDDDRKARYRADLSLSWMLVAVSALLLLVTCSGIVGMASLWVSQRRKQIGVRRALGARKRDILRYFIMENIIITSGGVAGGVLLGVALNQLLVSQLEMARLPPGYLAGGACVLWALGVLAVYGPAWRAAGISPAVATRSV